MAMRAHNLIWGSPGTHNPVFIRNEKNADVLEKYMTKYITETVKAIGDYPIAWDVVNEAIDDASWKYIKESPWSIIPDYICKAFKAAKAANPNIKMFYNDYNIHSMTGAEQSKSDRVYKLVKDLHDRKCGIDGVGFQTHIDITIPDSDYDGIKQNLKRYKNLGLDVHFTEVDVRCKKGPPGTKCDWGTGAWSSAALTQ
jgi:endo-1,4-beta-xylanase